MNEKLPEFNETDRRWIRADELRGRLGIKHAQFQRLNKSFGQPYLHRPDQKPGTPVWVYFPGWVAAWLRFENGAGGGTADEDQDDRLKRIRANREQLRYEKELEVLLHVRESLSDMELLGGILSEAIVKLPPKCQEIMLAAIDKAENEWVRRYGDGIERSETQGVGTTPGVDPADPSSSPA